MVEQRSFFDGMSDVLRNRTEEAYALVVSRRAAIEVHDAKLGTKPKTGIVGMSTAQAEAELRKKSIAPGEKSASDDDTDESTSDGSDDVYEELAGAPSSQTRFNKRRRLDSPGKSPALRIWQFGTASGFSQFARRSPQQPATSIGSRKVDRKLRGPHCIDVLRWRRGPSFESS